MLQETSGFVAGDQLLAKDNSLMAKLPHAHIQIRECGFGWVLVR